MKKLILVLFVMAGFMACVDESIEEIPLETSSIEELPQGPSSTANMNARVNPKIDICHEGDIINVSVNAIDDHQEHGDAIDMDGDGYFDIDNVCSETDCDDNDPNIYPGAPESIIISNLRTYSLPECLFNNETYVVGIAMDVTNYTFYNDPYPTVWLNDVAVQHSSIGYSYDTNTLILGFQNLSGSGDVDVRVEIGGPCSSIEVDKLYTAPNCVGI